MIHVYHSQCQYPSPAPSSIIYAASAASPQVRCKYWFPSLQIREKQFSPKIGTEK
jgi:hypothetical protein